MSENLDLVRSIVAAWERSEYNSPEWAHQEIEFRFADGPEPSLWTGIRGMNYLSENVSTAVSDATFDGGVAGLRQWISDTFAPLDDDARFEREELLAEGDDFLVLRVRITGRGARSGAPVELRWVSVSWFHDGKITRTAGYLRRREALEAVGLEG
jgi:ketosteroid isomerase-like protein